MSLSVLALANGHPAATSATAQNGCNSYLPRQEASITSRFNATQEVNLAVSSPEYKSASSGYLTKYSNIYYVWSFDANCDSVLDSANVVFLLQTLDGITKASLVVSLNPSLTQVTKATLQNVLWSHSSTEQQSTWSGYEFYNTSTPLVNTAVMLWQVPYVSQSPQQSCTNELCVLSAWVGISASAGGGGGLVQTGTDSILNCASGCQHTYEAWLEDYPNFPTDNCFSPNQSDQIYADVYIYPDSNGNLIPYAYIADNTIGKNCETSYSAESTYYGQFMVERPCYPSGCPAGLPEFNTLTIQGEIFYGSPCTDPYYCPPGEGIYIPYNAGMYNEYEMVNGGTLNIALSTVTQGSQVPGGGGAYYGQFTETWKSSSGT